VKWHEILKITNVLATPVYVTEYILQIFISTVPTPTFNISHIQLNDGIENV